MRPVDKISLQVQNWCARPDEIVLTNYFLKAQAPDGSFTFFEADVLRRTQAGFLYEYEIKTSKADLGMDFKKESGGVNKHESLQKGLAAANRFFFVVPAGLIAPAECPSHAGLIYAHANRLEIVKNAPMLHKRKNLLDLSSLMRQLCFRERNWHRRVQDLQNENKRLKKSLTQAREGNPIDPYQVALNSNLK